MNNLLTYAGILVFVGGGIYEHKGFMTLGVLLILAGAFF
jgi:hypothetical protein